MKGNIITEMRKVVKELYNEGHSKIFTISIQSNGDEVDRIQVVDTNSLAPKELSRDDFKNTYNTADNVIKLVKSRYGDDCKAVVAVTGNATSEEVTMNGSFLQIKYLSI